jgi:hypothetical protein
MAYQITYETADGSVENFTTETTKARAMTMARNCAKGSALNEACEVVRWFVEANDATVATFPVAH